MRIGPNFGIHTIIVERYSFAKITKLVTSRRKKKEKEKERKKTDYFFYLLVGATNLNGTIVGDTVFNLGSTLVGSGSLFGR
jgi:hypothetical protein